LVYEKMHMVGNAFMGSAPGHKLWKVLLPETVARYERDTFPKDKKDATKITGPVTVDQVVQNHPTVTRTCALLRPDVTAPAYDLNQKPFERCQRILRHPKTDEMVPDIVKGTEFEQPEAPRLRVCRKVKADGRTNQEYPLAAFMVHHWAHTWFEGGQRFGARTNIGKNVVLGPKLLEGRKDEIRGWMSQRTADATANVTATFATYNLYLGHEKVAGREPEREPEEEKEGAV